MDFLFGRTASPAPASTTTPTTTSALGYDRTRTSSTSAINSDGKTTARASTSATASSHSQSRITPTTTTTRGRGREREWRTPSHSTGATYQSRFDRGESRASTSTSTGNGTTTGIGQSIATGLARFQQATRPLHHQQQQHQQNEYDATLPSASQPALASISSARASSFSYNPSNPSNPYSARAYSHTQSAERSTTLRPWSSSMSTRKPSASDTSHTTMVSSLPTPATASASASASTPAATSTSAAMATSTTATTTTAVSVSQKDDLCRSDTASNSTSASRGHQSLRLPAQEIKLLRSILMDESYLSTTMDDDTVANASHISMDSLLPSNIKPARAERKYEYFQDLHSEEKKETDLPVPSIHAGNNTSILAIKTDTPTEESGHTASPTQSESSDSTSTNGKSHRGAFPDSATCSTEHLPPSPPDEREATDVPPSTASLPALASAPASSLAAVPPRATDGDADGNKPGAEPPAPVSSIGASARSKMRQLEQTFLALQTHGATLISAPSASTTTAKAPSAATLERVQSDASDKADGLTWRLDSTSIFRGLKSPPAVGSTTMESSLMAQMQRTSSSMSSSRIFEDSTTSTEVDAVSINGHDNAHGDGASVNAADSSSQSAPSLLTPASVDSATADLRRVAALELLAKETSRGWNINGQMAQVADQRVLSLADDESEGDFDLLLDLSPGKHTSGFEPGDAGNSKSGAGGKAHRGKKTHADSSIGITRLMGASGQKPGNGSQTTSATGHPKRQDATMANRKAHNSSDPGTQPAKRTSTFGDNNNKSSHSNNGNSSSSPATSPKNNLLVAPLAPGESSGDDDNHSNMNGNNMDTSNAINTDDDIEANRNGSNNGNNGNNSRRKNGSNNGNNGPMKKAFNKGSTSHHFEITSESSSDNASSFVYRTPSNDMGSLDDRSGSGSARRQTLLPRSQHRSDALAPLTDDPLILRMPNTAFGISMGLAGNALLWKTVVQADFLVGGESDNGELAVFRKDNIELANTIMWFAAFVSGVMITLAYLYKCLFHPDFFWLEWRSSTRIHFCNGPNLAMLMLTLSIPDAVQSSNQAYVTVFSIGLVYQVIMTQVVYSQWMFGADRSGDASSNMMDDSMGHDNRTELPLTSAAGASKSPSGGDAEGSQLTCAQPQFFLSIVGWFLLSVLAVQADIEGQWGIPMASFCLGIGTIFALMLLISVFQGLYQHAGLRGSPALTLMIAIPSLAVVALHGIENGTLSLDVIDAPETSSSNGDVNMASTSASFDFGEDDNEAAKQGVVRGEFPLAGELLLGWCCFMVLLLLKLGPKICQNPSTFGAYWAYVFPLSSLASALTRYAVVMDTRATHVMAGASIGIATMAVMIVFLRMFWHLLLTSFTERYTWADPLLNLPSDLATSTGSDWTLAEEEVAARTERMHMQSRSAGLDIHPTSTTSGTMTRASPSPSSAASSPNRTASRTGA